MGQMLQTILRGRDRYRGERGEERRQEGSGEGREGEKEKERYSASVHVCTRVYMCLCVHACGSHRRTWGVLLYHVLIPLRPDLPLNPEIQ